MLYVLRPQSPSTVSYSRPVYLELDPEVAYVERKRREYLNSNRNVMPTSEQ